MGKSLFDEIKQSLPTISSTEQIALDAGDVWWDKELFSGSPNWDELFKESPPTLTPEEKDFLDGPVQDLCEIVDDYAIYKDQDLPPEIWSYLREHGFFGLIIPKEYGGKGFSDTAHSAVVMKIASRSVPVAVTVMVPNSLGPGKLIKKYGSEEEKQRYLPKLATGEEFPCFALTGPHSGSDAAALAEDEGVIEYDPKAGTVIRLSWNKRYITLAPKATIMGLAFRLKDPGNILGNGPDLGIAVALIPTDHPGVEIGRRHDPLGSGFMNGPTTGKDVVISHDMVLHSDGGYSSGWKMLMECLSVGRSISLPALSVGGAKLAAGFTGAYAAIRKQFGVPIGKFEGVEEKLAIIAGRTLAMDSTRLLTLSALERGYNPAVLSAITKYHLTEMGREVLNIAMDIQGGSGIVLGNKNLFGRLYQQNPIAITVEGANILTRSMIIFGQGGLRNHPFVQDLVQAIQSEDEGRFNKTVRSHIRWTLGNVAHLLFNKLTFERFAPDYDFFIYKQNYIKEINRLSLMFSILADVTMMTLGGSIKRKESLSGLLGDTLSYLYISSAVIYHTEHEDINEDLIEWCMEDLFFKIENSMREAIDNFPVASIRRGLRILLFPFGNKHNKPSHALNKKAAATLLHDGYTRHILKQGIFESSVPSEQTHMLNTLLTSSHILDNYDARARIALKQGKTPPEPTDEESQLLDLRNRMVQVDSHEEL